MNDGIVEAEVSSAARLWQEFVRYMIRHAGGEPAAVAVLILVEGNVPMSWWVDARPAGSVPSGEPGDTERQWQAFVRHLLGRCKDNRGYGILRAQVIVAGRRPYFWTEAELVRIHPLEVVGDSSRESVLRILFPSYVGAFHPAPAPI